MGIRSFVKNLLEKRNLSASDPRAWTDLSGLQETAAGVSVSHDKALTLSAVYAAIRAPVEDLAAMPLLTYRRAANGDRMRDDSHYLFKLLHDSPNDYMTSQDFREALGGQVELRGNAYAEIERDGSGRPVKLWPLRADSVQPMIGANGTLFYQISSGANQRQNKPGGVMLPQRLVLHLHGWSSNGIVGYDPIAIHRETVAHGLALQEFGSRFFGNGSRPGGILVHPGKLNDQSRKNLRESWEIAHRGLTQSHRVAVLEEGIKWEQVGIAPENAQYIESRKFTVSDAARIWRIPPHMIGDLDRATFSNIEQQALEYVSYSLIPRAKRWENRISFSLLSDEQSSVFVEHQFAGVLRGDIKTRFDAYAIARQWGWMSANDIRRLENMNALGSEGDIYLSPLNMIPAGTEEKANNDA